METDASALYLHGVRLRDAGDLNTALATFEKVEHSLTPDAPTARNALLARIRLLGLDLGRPMEAFALCERAVANDPQSRSLLFLRARLLLALHRKVAALHTFKRMIRQFPDDGAICYEIAKVLRSAGRSKAALTIARRALAHGDRQFGLFALLAQLSLIMQEPEACIEYLDQAKAIRELPSHLINLLERAVACRSYRERALTRGQMRLVRHIAIGGHSYSGSTLLGALLGSLDGTGHAGETQELIHRFDRLTSKSPIIDFEHDSDGMMTHCRMCGPHCKVFTREFRAGLVADRFDFYQRIGQRLGVDTLITSDKFTSELLTKDPLFDFDLVILYKPLRSWLRSYARQKCAARANMDSGARMDTLRNWIRHWASSYTTLMNDIQAKGCVITVNWEAFVRNPYAHFERLITRLGLAGDPAFVFEHVRPGHYVGGNMTPSVVSVMRTGHIEFKQSDAPPLDAAEESVISEEQDAVLTEHRLDRRYARDFPCL